MGTRPVLRMLGLLAGVAALLWPTTAWAQSYGAGSGMGNGMGSGTPSQGGMGSQGSVGSQSNQPTFTNGPKAYGEDGGGSDRFSRPEPYDHQLYCPVTGEKLGLRQPAVPVQTSIGAKQPGALARFFGKKPTPGLVIYVANPQAAEAVRKNPQTYLSQVVADRALYSSTYSYTSAPPRRPGSEGADLTPVRPATGVPPVSVAQH